MFELRNRRHLFKSSLVLFLLVNIFTVGFSIQFYQNGQMDLKLAAASSSSSDVKPKIVWDTFEYTFSAKLTNELYSKIVLDMNNSIFQTMVKNAYIQINDLRIGKQTLPFGSYTSRTISRPFTRTFEEVVRLGVSYKINYQDVFITYLSAFNNSIDDATSGLAGKFVVIPRPEIVFAVSGLFDQELNGSGKRLNKLDVHGMAELNFTDAIVDMEFYRCLAGVNETAMAFNGSLTVMITKVLDMVFRFEGANSKGSEIVGKKSMFSGGVNFKVNSNVTYSLEGAYIKLSTDKELITISSRMALNF